MKVVELRKLLKVRGMDTRGGKMELREKVFDMMEDDVAALLRQVLESAPGNYQQARARGQINEALAQEAKMIEQRMAELSNEKRGKFEAANNTWFDNTVRRVELGEDPHELDVFDHHVGDSKCSQLWRAWQNKSISVLRLTNNNNPPFDGMDTLTHAGAEIAQLIEARMPATLTELC